MGFGHVETFLFKFSLQVGVVTICSVGIMLMSTSLWVNIVTQDPEIKTWARGAHWTVVSVFDVSGLGIYTLGMIAAHSESSRLANLLFIFLVLHGLMWLALTIIAFGNWAALNRAVCIDNRCADRLFIKNGNWRITFGGDCENPSMERWLESAGHNPQVIPEELAKENYKKMGKNLGPPELENYDWDSEMTLPALPNGNASLLGLPGIPPVNHIKTNGLSRVLLKAVAKYNHTLVHTPIGYVGCNASAHIIYSAVCALLIMGFWYVYPIIVFKSFADDLNKKRPRVEKL